MGPHHSATAAVTKHQGTLAPLASGAATTARQARRKAVDSSSVAVLRAVLPKLAEYLVDGNAEVIQSTQKCMRELVKYEETIQALEQLDRPTQQCLMVYKKVCWSLYKRYVLKQEMAYAIAASHVWCSGSAQDSCHPHLAPCQVP